MSRLKQQVRVELTVTVEFDGSYTQSDLENMIRRGAGLVFPNNAKHINELKFTVDGKTEAVTIWEKEA
jgi:hypothetical protein